MAELEHHFTSWKENVQAHLLRNNGRATLGHLGDRVKMPPPLRDILLANNVRYKQALLKVRFHIAGRDLVCLEAPPAYDHASVAGLRRGRDRDTDDDDDDDSLRRHQSRRRTASPGYDFGPSPEEATRCHARTFGTPYNAHAAPSTRLAAAPPPLRPSSRGFDWDRFEPIQWRRPKSAGQELYVQALEDARAQIVVCTGPAGCGKTFLAVQQGLKELIAGKIDRIIMSRPAVTAGESLGFLPGAEKDKLQPLLAPLLDCVDEILGQGAWAILLSHRMLELQSFAYMRGRTHHRSFVIADEAQNATKEQMTMLMTRIGDRPSKTCILGDAGQPDLTTQTGANALAHVTARIKGGIAHGAGEGQMEDVLVVRELTIEDCQRSETARAMARITALL